MYILKRKDCLNGEGRNLNANSRPNTSKNLITKLFAEWNVNFKRGYYSRTDSEQDSATKDEGNVVSNRHNHNTDDR